MDLSNFEIRPTEYGGLGLFYIGSKPIEIGEEVIKEKAFFTSPDVINIGGITLRENAAIAYTSLMTSNKMLDDFILPEVSPAFKKNCFLKYKQEITELTNIFEPVYPDLDKKTLGKKILDEICKHAINRIICKIQIFRGPGCYIHAANEWGYFEHITRINHSCDPNLEINDIVIPTEIFDGIICGDRTASLKAIKRINTGDELKYTYADKSQLDDSYGFICKCSNCDIKPKDGMKKKRSKTKRRRSKSRRRKTKRRRSKSRRRKTKRRCSKTRY
jgi:hypothetical protein